MNDSELEDVTCTAGHCVNPAKFVGHATLRVSPLVGAVRDEEEHTFSLPLCGDHAHLLRMDNTLVEFSNGMG